MAKYLYINDKKVLFEYSNFAFIYRFLIDNMNAETKAPKFRDYEELKVVTSSIIKIYEDFKKEFLLRMETDKLSKEPSPVANKKIYVMQAIC